MNLLSNPFCILEVTQRDNVAKISEVADEKSLFLDTKTCNDAKNMLINPVNRIKAEISWLPGVSPSKSKSIIDYINTISPADIDVENIHTTFSRHNPIVYANIEKTLLDIKDSIDYNNLYSIINDIAKCFDELDDVSLCEEINNARKLSAITPIRDIYTLKNFLVEHKQDCISGILNSIDKLDSIKLIALVTDLIDHATDSGQHSAPDLINAIVDGYEARIKVFLNKEQERLTNKAKEILDLDFTKIDKNLVNNVANQYIQELKHWDKFAQPIQLRCMSKGEHYEATHLGKIARQIAVKLFNSGYEEEANNFLRSLNNIFAEIGKITETINEDFATIDKIKHDRQEYKKKQKAEHEQWLKDIYFDDEIGLIFKDRLTLNESGVYWKFDFIKLDDIIAIKYGAKADSRTTQSLFYSRTDTCWTYSIGIKSATKEFIIKFKTRTSASGHFRSTEETEASKKYDKFTGCLWKAVVPRLLTQMIAKLKGGKPVEFANGYVLVYDDNIRLTKRHFLSVDEYFYCNINNISYGINNGSLYLKDPQHNVSIELSLSDVYNAHILYLALHMFKNSKAKKLSDILG